MKRMLVLVLAVMMLALAACGAGTQKVGGWTLPKDGKVTEEAKNALEKAAEGLMGVGYVPVALLGTQVVSGTNYCLLCEATVVYPDAKPYYAVVTVYRDLQGNARVLNIVALDLGKIAETGKIEDAQADGAQTMGGWSVDRDSTVKVKDGVLHLASQVVAGRNHCVLCSGWKLVFVYEDLKGKTEVTATVDLDVEALARPAAE